jgi:hypothetical protein
MGQYNSLSPAGIFMGVAGGTLALVLYNKVNQIK